MRIVRAVGFVLPMLCTVAAPVGAATVNKCRLPDGRVIYQDADCARGGRTLARWDTPPDPPVAHAPPPRVAPHRRASNARRRVAMRVASTPDPCRAAKERRDATERRVGLARTYELLSALQRDVYEACK